ncbi:hypothetical protein GCM10010517_76650 [Streptosporangium fragile]|uniref:Uncharacterized protein n=1 Tax=Streptosporangium fragile TaxID=46186 RepID=A0ABN3WD61_9ACTN
MLTARVPGPYGALVACGPSREARPGWWAFATRLRRYSDLAGPGSPEGAKRPTGRRAGRAVSERTRLTKRGVNATGAFVIGVTDAPVGCGVRRQGLESRTR